jgi:hypothetical protein
MKKNSHTVNHYRHLNFEEKIKKENLKFLKLKEYINIFLTVFIF